jgi:GT2 family glycosyltransferase
VGARFPQHVTVIVLHPSQLAAGGLCLSLALTEYPSFDIVVVDNGERTDATRRGTAIRSRTSTKRRVVDGAIDYQKVNNAAAAHGEILLFLNDDTEVLDPSWMRDGRLYAS